MCQLSCKSQFLWSLVQWSYRRITTHAMYSTVRQKAWKQSLHIIALAGGSVAYISFITQVISLNSCDIFFLVTRMK